MRLLNTKTLQLESIPHEDVSYAILSHRWGSNEVIFQDMASDHAKDKKGYEKIRMTCQLALQHGLYYAWIDSCCINKESSSELSESINSMWRWYCNAKVCFAYLDDVDGSCPELRDRDIFRFDEECAETTQSETQQQQDRGHAQLSKSLYFTRGWTLQELIAPEHVEIYNKDWRRIGSKKSLVLSLNAITGIDPAALQDRNTLPSFTVAKKLSWAANRKTKYREDRAYSVLGIFGVQMPLLYGEGDNAVIRLQEEIIKTSTDLSIFTWEPFNHRAHSAREDLLFATSLDQFRSCGNIISYHEDCVDSSFRLNNRGIVFEKLNISESKRGRFGILNCRFEDDLRGPIALRLCREDEFTVRFDNDSVLLAGDDQWIGWSLQDQKSSTIHRLKDWAISERLIVYPREGFARAKHTDESATLLRYHPMDLLKTARPLFRFNTHPKIWLKHDKNNPQSKEFEVIEAWPSVLWRLKTATMVPLIYSGMPRHLTAWVKLDLKNSLDDVIVAFYVELSMADKNERGLPEGSEFRIVINKGSVAHAMKLLERSAPSMTANFTYDDILYTANAQLEKHLGEIVLAISILAEKLAEESPRGKKAISKGQDMGKISTFRRKQPSMREALDRRYEVD